MVDLSRDIDQPGRQAELNTERADLGNLVTFLHHRHHYKRFVPMNLLSPNLHLSPFFTHFSPDTNEFLYDPRRAGRDDVDDSGHELCNQMIDGRIGVKSRCLLLCYTSASPVL